MKRQLVSELIEVADGLDEDEVNVLLTIAHRLAMGQQRYGPLVILRDRRDWAKEASEELLDGCVYLAIKALKERAR